MGEEQYKNQNDFLDLLPEIVFEIDSDLNVRFLNQACYKVLGYEKSDFLDKKIPFNSLFPSSDIKKVKKSISDNFSGKHNTGNNYSVLNKNKEVVILNIHNSHIIKNNNIIGLRCIAVDVTKKESEKQRLSSQEKHYRDIFQNSPIAYQSLDIDGNLIDVNPTWEKITGYKKSTILGKNFKSILTDEYAVKFEKAYDVFKKKGEISNLQFNIKTKNKTIIFVNYNGKIEYLENGEFSRSHCVFNDITLQKKAEQTLIESEIKLRELNATKDKFFSLIAHDLKNPFNDLIGFTQLLSMNIDKYDKSKIEQFAKIIHQSSKLAYNLLENLLDWSRAQTGTLKYKPEKISLNQLINDNIELLESNAKNKNIRIFSEINSNSVAFADENMIRTVVRNLISNAIKYTNQGGIIKISSSCKKNVCEISVSDNGIGIDAKHIGKIFKIDESFSTPGTEREKGTGLGLILCKEFIEKNGGTLMVNSELNKGSIFTFTLPAPDLEF